MTLLQLEKYFAACSFKGIPDSKTCRPKYAVKYEVYEIWMISEKQL